MVFLGVVRNIWVSMSYDYERLDMLTKGAAHHYPRWSWIGKLLLGLGIFMILWGIGVSAESRIFEVMDGWVWYLISRFALGALAVGTTFCGIWFDPSYFLLTLMTLVGFFIFVLQNWHFRRMSKKFYDEERRLKR